MTPQQRRPLLKGQVAGPNGVRYRGVSLYIDVILIPPGHAVDLLFIFSYYNYSAVNHDHCLIMMAHHLLIIVYYILIGHMTIQEIVLVVLGVLPLSIQMMKKRLSSNKVNVVLVTQYGLQHNKHNYNNYSDLRFELFCDHHNALQ